MKPSRAELSFLTGATVMAAEVLPLGLGAGTSARGLLETYLEPEGVRLARARSA